MHEVNTELKGETHTSTIIIREFNIPLSVTHKITGQNMKKKQTNKKEGTNSTIKQPDLTFINTKLHPKVAEYTFFKSTHETFPRIDVKRFCQHDGRKLQINDTKEF